MSGRLPALSRPRHTTRPVLHSIVGLRLIVLVVAVLGIALTAAPAADRRESSEYEAKSALVISLIKFVDWPAGTFADRRAPMIVGVLGDGPAEVVERCLQGKLARERRLVVRRYRHARDLEPVHVLFVFSDASSELTDARRTLRPSHVLTITEVPGVSVTEAVINLMPVGTRFGFAVNLDQADGAGLRISPNLLTLSREVHSTRLRRQG